MQHIFHIHSISDLPSKRLRAIWDGICLAEPNRDERLRLLFLSLNGENLWRKAGEDENELALTDAEVARFGTIVDYFKGYPLGVYLLKDENGLLRTAFLYHLPVETLYGKVFIGGRSVDGKLSVVICGAAGGELKEFSADDVFAQLKHPAGANYRFGFPGSVRETRFTVDEDDQYRYHIPAYVLEKDIHLGHCVLVEDKAAGEIINIRQTVILSV